MLQDCFPLQYYLPDLTTDDLTEVALDNGGDCNTDCPSIKPSIW